MIDVRDCAAVHIAAATTPDAAGKRFLTSTAQSVPRNRLVELLRQAYPQWQIAPTLLEESGGLNEWAGWQEGRTVFCSKPLGPVLHYTLGDIESTLLDMAAKMLELGVIQPKNKEAEKAEL